MNNVAFLRHMVTSLAHQQGSGVMQVPTDYDYSKARTAANPNPNPAPNPGPNSNPSPTPTPTPNPLYKATCENYRAPSGDASFHGQYQALPLPLPLPLTLPLTLSLPLTPIPNPTLALPPLPQPQPYPQPSQAIRATRDYGYHSHYTRERQLWQDGAVESVVSRTEPQPRPWIVYTCGPMGAGKLGDVNSDPDPNPNPDPNPIPNCNPSPNQARAMC